MDLRVMMEGELREPGSGPDWRSEPDCRFRRRRSLPSKRRNAARIL